eukprot:322371-Pyramimonas_sp.AAC.1
MVGMSNYVLRVLSEYPHVILDTDQVATMQVYATAAAKRAVVVKEDDLLTQADIQANPETVSKVLYTELRTRFDNKCFNMQYIAKASNIMISRCARTWKFVKNEKGELERTIRLRLVLR